MPSIDDQLITFGTSIRKAREDLGMTGSDLADEALGNRDRKDYISNLENGNINKFTVHTIHNIRKVIEVLGIPTEEFEAIRNLMAGTTDDNSEERAAEEGQGKQEKQESDGYDDDRARESIRRITKSVLDAATEDMRGKIEKVISGVEAALDKPEDELNRQDVLFLFKFQAHVLSLLNSGRNSLAPDIGKAQATRASINSFIARVSAAPITSIVAQVDGTMLDDFRLVRSQILKIEPDVSLGSVGKPQNTDAYGFAVLCDLHEILDEAIDTERVNIGHLSFASDTARLALKREFDSGFAMIARAIGRAVNSRMFGAVFMDLFGAPELVVVKSGASFEMGYNGPLEAGDAESTAEAAASPKQDIRIVQSFAMARYALRRDEYVRFCGVSKRSPPSDEGWGAGDFPAVNISWDDACDYCEWLSEATGAQYRLPTEAEWEYVCRSGTTSEYSFGVELAAKDAHFKSSDTEDQADAPFPKPVDDPAYSPNAFGMHQMHGNVWEWCQDDLSQDYSDQPGQGSKRSPDTTDHKIIRGGSWNDDALLLRSWYRQSAPKTTRQPNIGVRVVRVLS